MDTTLTIIVAVAVLYNFGKRVGESGGSQREKVMGRRMFQDGKKTTEEDRNWRERVIKTDGGRGAVERERGSR